MGSLADLIVASESETQAIVTSEYPLGEFSGVNVDGLDPLLLASLHASLTDKDFSQVLAEYKPVAEASPTGPWLIPVPVELIEKLTHVAPQDISAAAAQWAARDEPLKAGWSPQDAEKYLGQIVHFAQTADFESKGLFLWVYD